MKSDEIKQGDSLGQGAAATRTRKHNCLKRGESIRLPCVLSSNSAGCSPRSSTIPGQAHQAPPSVISLFEHEIQRLASIISFLLSFSSQKKQTNKPTNKQKNPPKTNFQAKCCKPSSSQDSWNTGQETLMLLNCYCSLRWLLQMPNSHPFPSLSQSQSRRHTRSFCREREIPPEPAGQEAPCPGPPGSSRQRPCTHLSLEHATNNILNCCHFQNTRKIKTQKTFCAEWLFSLA